MGKKFYEKYKDKDLTEKEKAIFETVYIALSFRIENFMGSKPYSSTLDDLCINTLNKINDIK